MARFNKVYIYDVDEVFDVNDIRIPDAESADEGKVIKVDSNGDYVLGTGGGGGSSTLAGLSDTDINTPADGQVLAYDANTSKWVNANASGGGDVTYFSNDSGVGVIPSDGIRLETVSSSSAFSVNPDVVTVVSGTVGTATITLQVPSDNLAHVWDIIMTTSSSPSITIAASNSATIKYPMNFYWGASRDVEVSIVGASTKCFVRYGEFA